MKSLETSGLLAPIDGRAVEVGGSVTLAGVGGDSDPSSVAEALTDRSDDGTVLVACGDADLLDPDDALLEPLVDDPPTRPVAVVAGKRTDPVRNGRAGVPLLDPGSVEHVLSKSTIGSEQPARGVDEYAIADGELAVTRRTLDVRPFSTFEFTVDGSTTLGSIAETVADHDLEDRAVLATLMGSGRGARRPPREAVQSLLAEEAFCARVYDERSIPDDADGTDPDPVERGETGPAGSGERQTDRLSVAVGDLADVVATMESLESADASNLETAELADGYAVLSKAKSEVDALRKAARDELTSRVGPNETVAGEVGAVSSTKQRRRRLRDAETVEAALREHDIPVERVTTEAVDAEKVEEVLESADGIAEDDLFEVTEREYVRRQDLDLAGGLEPGAPSDGGESTGEAGESAGGTGSSSGETDGESHTVYLGDGAPIGGWTPVERSVVEEEVVPLVEAHAGRDDEATIAMNFGSGVSIGGWHRVDTDVVRERIVPLVERHRVD